MTIKEPMTFHLPVFEPSRNNFLHNHLFLYSEISFDDIGLIPQFILRAYSLDWNYKDIIKGKY